MVMEGLKVMSCMSAFFFIGGGALIVIVMMVVIVMVVVIMMAMVMTAVSRALLIDCTAGHLAALRASFAKRAQPSNIVSFDVDFD